MGASLVWKCSSSRQAHHQYAALRRINPRKKRTKYLIKLRSLIHSQCHGMIHDFHVVERVAHGSPPTLGIQILGSCCLMSHTDMPRRTWREGGAWMNEMNDLMERWKIEYIWWVCHGPMVPSVLHIWNEYVSTTYSFANPLTYQYITNKWLAKGPLDRSHYGIYLLFCRLISFNIGLIYLYIYLII